ncbi:hypothetical protein Poli38472_007875 [Pythium oligandrum]|uniref:Uncharacterized protein n=1 Tax=Pythium oligandrum TaxID=41045 RepID=A0A8K1FS45_PYTOL|nr:hypothetical protein Poli38472_007875 [Pythium oligandrum]|eukprot:TMW68203.1 hypothetical protein Poli38472_007875 [Pythium oligandrum]
MLTTTTSDASVFSNFEFDSSDCHAGTGTGRSVAFPSSQNKTEDGNVIPSVIIDKASIVVNFTNVNVENVSNLVFDISGYSNSYGHTWATFDTSDTIFMYPKVGELVVVKGQSLKIVPKWVDTNDCSLAAVSLEAALIGDFCKRSPAAKVCKGHNPKVTMPPAGVSPTTSDSSSTEGTGQKKVGITPAPSSALSVTRPSTRRVLLSLVMASLAIGLSAQ